MSRATCGCCCCPLQLLLPPVPMWIYCPRQLPLLVPVGTVLARGVVPSRCVCPRYGSSSGDVTLTSMLLERVVVAAASVTAAIAATVTAQVDRAVILKTVGGPKRFRPKTREEMSVEVGNLAPAQRPRCVWEPARAWAPSPAARARAHLG